MDEVRETGIPWLTTRERDFLAHLSVMTIQAQLKPARSYERISDALGELAEQGEVQLRADDENVWVLILDEIIVHAARDWLRWATERWAPPGATSTRHVVPSQASLLPR